MGDLTKPRTLGEAKTEETWLSVESLSPGSDGHLYSTREAGPRRDLVNDFFLMVVHGTTLQISICIVYPTGISDTGD
jgi:hypothetical protein